jgi:protein TonB
MKFLLQIVILLAFHFSFSQELESKSKSNDTIVKSKSTTKNELNGGISKFYEYINKNFIQPDFEYPSGKVIIVFTIKADGSVADVKLVKDMGFGIGRQLKQIIELSKGWTPGVKNGIPVDCTYTLPINIAGSYN